MTSYTTTDGARLRRFHRPVEGAANLVAAARGYGQREALLRLGSDAMSSAIRPAAISASNWRWMNHAGRVRSPMLFGVKSLRAFPAETIDERLPLRPGLVDWFLDEASNNDSAYIDRESRTGPAPRQGCRYAGLRRYAAQHLRRLSGPLRRGRARFPGPPLLSASDRSVGDGGWRDNGAPGLRPEYGADHRPRPGEVS
jgi:hypothetical protein